MSDMSRSEAISILKKLKLDAEDYGKESDFVKQAVEAFDTAISSLETDEAYQLEYERTTKNDCETCIHNKGVLECDMYGCKYEPTTKENLAVDVPDNNVGNIEDCISKADALKLNVYAPIAPIVEGENVHWEEIILTEELRKLPSVLLKADKNDLGVDWDELKRKILMEVDGGTDDAWLAYGEVCDRISNSIDEFVADMREVKA